MGTEKEEPDCQKQFQAAVSVIQNLPKNGSYRPSYEEMLRFYSYYKQATMGPCLVPRPGFWDPIGRYKWDAWNSLGKMSREEAMSAYISEMKLVAQKVIDTVPLGEVAEDMFGYFEPLYQVIPDMPRPPDTFLRRVTGWKEPGVHRDHQAAPEPSCLPKEPVPPSPEGLGGGLMGPQELDRWLVGTVRAMQESMKDVHRRLQSLESKPQPLEQQRSPRTRPWLLGLSAPTLLFFILWPFVVQWLFRQFRTQKR
uniref:acyl-CoA-binding domain-containing protein 4 isoform X2 n=1 Tax=Arvicanthis niloticus TaxID=61156 RepID=UPI0014863986|nr:acyl-CoA-binding domain-containing protein 4 isoform X2 [Arvicanthis niloticus]